MTARLAAAVKSTHQTSGRSRSRVASYCSWCSRVRVATNRAIVQSDQAEQPQLLAGRRVDGEPVGIVGDALRAAHLVGVAIEPDRALAQQPMRRQPRRRQHQRRPPGEPEQHHRHGQAADHAHQAAGDEVHRVGQRRSGHAAIELTGHGEVGGQAPDFRGAPSRADARRPRSGGRRARRPSDRRANG